MSILLHVSFLDDLSTVKPNLSLEEIEQGGRTQERISSFSRARFSRFDDPSSASIFYLCQGLSYNRESSLEIGRTPVTSMGGVD